MKPHVNTATVRLNQRLPCSNSRIIEALSLIAAVIAGFCPLRIDAQAPPQIVGRIEGRDFLIEEASGALPNGQIPGSLASSTLASGSHLDVRTGQARILLNGGGEIVICGPARLQVLKAPGALTVALDYGTMHINVAGTDPISIFTPLVLATPISIGAGARETILGLEHTGQMCLRALSGAVRVEQQLSGESLLVPQFGQLSLAGGQLATAAPSAPGCSCEIDAAKITPLRPTTTHETVSALGTKGKNSPADTKKSVIAPPLPVPNATETSAGPPQDPTSFDVPIYKVLMPPLVYDASSPVPPPDPSPDTIILVRSVRVREDTVIYGTIEGKGKSESRTLSAKVDARTQQSQPGFFARVGGFFRRVFGGKS